MQDSTDHTAFQPESDTSSKTIVMTVSMNTSEDRSKKIQSLQ